MSDDEGVCDIQGSLLAANDAGADSHDGAWALLERALAGHEPAARALVQALAPKALRAAMRVMARREDAEDAVQEAFLSLWRRPPQPGLGARLSTYVVTVVLNNCRSMLRARRLLDPLDEDAEAGQTGAQPHDALFTAISMSRQGAQERLSAALMRLSPRQRLAIGMWAYADASPGEIAEALLIDDNAASQLLHRARCSLRKHFEGDIHVH